MDGVIFLLITVLALVGMAVGAKIVVYFGTLAYFEARHAFYGRFKKDTE